MIISRAPFRVSLFGGSTDYESFYKDYGSICIGTTIGSYTYCSMRFRPSVVNHESVITYSQLEKTNDHTAVKNPLIRETLVKFGITEAVDLHLFGDMPSRTGLGGSSACCVALCHSARSLLGLPVTKKILAEDAIEIERHILDEPGGIQDQIWSSYGGFNSIEIKKNGSFYIKPLPVTKEFISNFQSSCFLVYTNKQRKTSRIAKSHTSHKSEAAKQNIKTIALEAYKMFCKQNIRSIGELMMEGWSEKKKISKIITTPEICDLEKFLLDQKIYGLKLLGSGGSGFIAVLCDAKKKKKIAKEVKKLYKVLDLEVEFNGATSIL